ERGQEDHELAGDDAPARRPARLPQRPLPGSQRRRKQRAARRDGLCVLPRSRNQPGRNGPPTLLAHVHHSTRASQGADGAPHGQGRSGSCLEAVPNREPSELAGGSFRRWPYTHSRYDPAHHDSHDYARLRTTTHGDSRGRSVPTSCARQGGNTMAPSPAPLRRAHAALVAISLFIGALLPMASCSSPPAPTISEFAVPTLDGEPFAITSGPKGDLWFTEHKGNKIGRITKAGAISEFDIPTFDSRPTGITLGPDDNLWFTEEKAGKVGRVTKAGVITGEVAIPLANSEPSDITAGPDGAL